MQVNVPQRFEVQRLIRSVRSRALQIGMNLSALEEWMRDSGLPRAIEAHFAPVRELLQWLQVSLFKCHMAAVGT